MTGGERRLSFSFDDGESVGRPERVRDVSFEDVWFGRWLDLAGGVVPLEQLRAGDRQVGIFMPLRSLDPPPVELDRLAGYPSVRSVVGFGPVVLRTPLPAVEELYVDVADEETLANLPNLRRAIVSFPYRSRDDPSAVFSLDDLSVVSPKIVDLLCHVEMFGSVERLVETLPALERLQIGGLFDRSAAPLAALSELRWLGTDAAKGLAKLGPLRKLESVSLDVEGRRFSGLRAFEGWGRLQRLRISGRGLKSIDGMEHFVSLESLFLYRTGVVDLSPLAGLARLADVRLDHPDRVGDFSPLGALPALRSLRIDLAPISGVGSVPTIGFLRGSERLERLWLDAEIEDRDLSPLFELPALREVAVYGELRAQVAELQRRRPELQIHWGPPLQAEGVWLGSVRYCELSTGEWSIFQDMMELLGVESNIEAEGRVKGAISDHDLELFGRLDFDSEPDALGVSAPTEADIRQVAEIIQELVAQPD